MSGSTPYTARSPTQSNQYPPYSPTHPSRPYYGHEPYQISPHNILQTPPPFAPVSLVQSPHHPRPPSLASPLAAANPLPPPPPAPLGVGPPYQPLNSSPPYNLQRSYSGHLVHQSMPAFDGTPTHAHPSGQTSPSLQSPLREHHAVTNGRATETSTSDSRPQSKEVCRPTFD